MWDSGNWNIKYTLCVKSKHYKLFEYKKAVSYVYDNLFAYLHMLKSAATESSTVLWRNYIDESQIYKS